MSQWDKNRKKFNLACGVKNKKNKNTLIFGFNVLIVQLLVHTLFIELFFHLQPTARKRITFLKFISHLRGLFKIAKVSS